VNFVNRVKYFGLEGSKWFNRVLGVAIFVAVTAAACSTNPGATFPQQQREVYVAWSETDAIATAYASILREAGYRLTNNQNAPYQARFYHEQRTNYCGGNARVYVRARMVVTHSGFEPLDMSSTEYCARDNIAAHLQLQAALEDDRRTYVSRLSSF